MTLLSVLDQIPIRSEVTSADAIQDTLRLADATDKWGYHRYWLAVVQFNSKRIIAGDPEQVRASIDELRQIYGVDEFVVISICHDFDARLRSYELLAQEFNLSAT